MNVNHLVEQCYASLPQELRQRPWTVLNHGYDVLDNEDKLNAYIASYGEMHAAKCRMALQNFPFEHLCVKLDSGEIIKVKDFEIFDWGCGQGIGSLILMELLYERDLLTGLKRVNLIEPSTYAIERAKEWVKQSAMAHTIVRTFERPIPTNGKPQWDDIDSCAKIAIHICSNILDVEGVGLGWLANTTNSLGQTNIYICVGPKYNRAISRIDDFHKYLGSPQCFSEFALYPCGYTIRTHHPYGIEVKGFVTTNDNVVNANYEEQSDQTQVDEYAPSAEWLKDILPDDVLQAYNSLYASTLGWYELYLQPAIGIERPDFALANLSSGIILINVCQDISKFHFEYERIESVKSSLFDTYIKSLKIGTILNPSTYNTIKTGLYFPNATKEEVQEACEDYYAEILERWEKQKEENPNFCSSKPKDPTPFLLKFFPSNCTEILKGVRASGFKFDYYQELRNLIVSKWHNYAQGNTSLKLTDRQKAIVDNDDTRLRVKGVAGCGKTQIVAHKAVKEHLRTGSRVLIVTFNISLIKYIQMRINQVPADFSLGAFDIINYHQFFLSKARRYHGQNIPFGASNDSSFFDPYLKDIIKAGDQYETIIIDEAQDYLTAWFDCLRKYFLKENGHFIILGDGEQNIFEREQDKETKMPRVYGGFKPWRRMNERISMRILNPKIANIASDFSIKYELSNTQLNPQNSLDLFDEYKVKYWNIPIDTQPSTLASNILWILQKYEIDPKEVAVLGQSISLLREVDYAYRTTSKRESMTTFESKEDYEALRNKVSLGRFQIDIKSIRRVAKVHFTTDTPALKFATIHSFKGWEAKTVIIILQSESDQDAEVDGNAGFLIRKRSNNAALIYTALTRSRENLFILNLGNEAYNNFFKERIKND